MEEIIVRREKLSESNNILFVLGAPQIVGSLEPQR